MKLKFIVCLFIVFFNCFQAIAQLPIRYSGFPIIPDTTRLIAFGGAGIPLVADLNSDGQNELIICGSGLNWSNPVLNVLNSNGNFLNGFPKPLIEYPVNFSSGDVNGDGYLDIVIRTYNYIFVYDRFGNNLSGFPVSYAGGGNSSFAALFDLDNDGKLEIITNRWISNDFTNLTVINHNGQTRQGWPVRMEKCYTSPALGDLDGDGFGEIIICDYIQNSNSFINIFKQDGSIYSANWPVLIDSQYFAIGNSPSLFVNENNYDSVFIYAVFTKGTLYNTKNKLIKTNTNGELLKTAYPEITNDALGTLVMGDINNDGRIEISTADQYYENLYLFDDELNLQPGWPKDGAGNYQNTVTIGKLKYGSNLQIISNKNLTYPFSAQYIYAYDHNGNNIEWSPLRLRGQKYGITFEDMNNDGLVEMFLAGDNSGVSYSQQFFRGSIYIFTIPGISYNMHNFPWPMYGHDRWRTNQYNFMPPDEPNAIKQVSNNVPYKFMLYQNYPNPFNPLTTIKFSVPHISENDRSIKLFIYNSIGQEVTKMIHENINPGTYEIRWNAEIYSSGVYFYTLNYGNYFQTKKMVLIK